MRADEARKTVEQTEQYQEEERLIIEEGERNINRAIKDGRMKCSSGLHFQNQHHWDSIIRYWKGLGYKIEWNIGGGYNPSRYPSGLSW